MSPTSRLGGRRGSIAAAVTVALALVGVTLIATSVPGRDAPPQPVAQSAPPAVAAHAPSRVTSAPTTSAVNPPDQSRPDFGPIMGPSSPVSLAIPSIGLRSKGIVDLHLDRNGKLEAPTDFAKAGWYAAGPTPGEFGPAVIGAHVDSKSGPAVFYRLGSLKKAAEVFVVRKDGSTARFLVDRVSRYSKADFPTATVYGDTNGRAELRLITCGGAFDRATGHYVDNIVAFAHLVTERSTR